MFDVKVDIPSRGESEKEISVGEVTGKVTGDATVGTTGVLSGEASDESDCEEPGTDWRTGETAKTEEIMGSRTDFSINGGLG